MNNLKASIASQIKAARTPAEELRSLLGTLEAQVGKLGHGMTEDPGGLLVALDTADTLLRQLAENGANLPAERARFETVIQQYSRKGKQFLKDVGGRAGLLRLRTSQPAVPPVSNWWWYIDERLDEERRTRRVRSLRSLGVAGATLIVLTVLYTLFLRPDEATRMRLRYQQDAEDALMHGNLAAALIAAEEALSYAPGDADLLVLQGATLELLERHEEAETVYARAREAVGDDMAYYGARSRAYLVGNRPDLALVVAQSMVDLDPNDPFAHLQMGNANAALGNLFEAGGNYEQAAELAREVGETELEGIARVQLANLLMRGPASPTASPSPPAP